MDRAVVENLNNMIYILSNDVSCDKGFHNLRLFNSRMFAMCETLEMRNCVSHIVNVNA